MPTYVADTDEDHIAALSGTFSIDEANKVITLGSNGECDTGYTFSTTAKWLLIEVYDVEGIVGDIGYTKHTNVNNITADLITARSIALSEYTTFKITAMHYRGNGTCDVYRGNETDDMTLFISNAPYTTTGVSMIINFRSIYVYR